MEEDDTAGSPHFCYLACSISERKLKHPLDATVHSAQKCWFHMLAGGSTFRQGVDLYLHGRVIPAFNPGEESTDRISLADRGVPDRGLVLCETFWSRHEVRLARRPKHVILDLPSTSTPSYSASFMLEDRAQRRGREHEPCATHAPLSLLTGASCRFGRQQQGAPSTTCRASNRPSSTTD